MPKQTFEEWMRQANNECLALCSMDLLDLPDVAFRDMYDEGKSPKTAARAAIREAKSDYAF